MLGHNTVMTNQFMPGHQLKLCNISDITLKDKWRFPRNFTSHTYIINTYTLQEAMLITGSNTHYHAYLYVCVCVPA